MQVRIVALGRRLPEWVETGIAAYLDRFPRGLRPEVKAVDGGGRRGAGASAAEGARLLAALGSRDRVVALAVDGETLDTEGLARRLAAWRQGGEDVALLVGGAEGLAPEVLARARERLSLSALTLPHALARLVLVEQLYRAHTVLEGHPYHRA